VGSAAHVPAFENGVAAYRRGDFSTALEQFERARAAGQDSDQLLFNLGLTLYRLERYPEAQAVFLELQARPDMVQVAGYHLGLVAAASGDNDAAELHLKAVAANGTPELRNLAGTALARIGRSTPVRRWTAYVRSGPGFDTNRNQIADTLEIEGPKPESAYADLYGVFVGRVRQLGDSTLQASAFVRNYEVDDELDQAAMQLLLRKSWRTLRWRYALAGEFESTMLDGEGLYDACSVRLEAARRLGKSTLRLHYRPSVISAGTTYDYLDGQRHQLEIGDELALGAARMQLGYEVEVNDRRDLERGAEFYSQSPVRHGPVLRWSRAVIPHLQLDLSAAYRRSRYRDENRQFVDGSFVTERRVDSLIVAGLVLRLDLGESWGLRLDYRHSDNRSTLAPYAYDRDVASLALEWRR
jgi:tetratricopeptide (TPR) repeat protein